MSKSHAPTDWTTLQEAGRICLEREGFNIEGQLDGQRLYLLTTVFNGGTFLPESIRRSLKGHALHALDSHLDITLTLDEENFRVLLLAQADVPAPNAFGDILNDFLELAHEWRYELDQNGQEDLIYVHVTD